MLKHNKREGYTYIDKRTGKEYSLYALHCLGGECTSDIVVIWDDEHENIFNWFYGETWLLAEPAELEKIVADYIESDERI